MARRKGPKRARRKDGRFKKGPARKTKKKTAKRKTKRKAKKNVPVVTRAQPTLTENQRRAKRRKAAANKAKSNPVAKRKKSRRNPTMTITKRLKGIPATLGSIALPGAGAIVISRLDDRFSNRLLSMARLKPIVVDGRTIQPMDRLPGKAIRALLAIGLGFGLDMLMPKAKKLQLSNGDLLSAMLLFKLGSEVVEDNVEPLLRLGPAAVEKKTTTTTAPPTTTVPQEPTIAGTNGAGRSPSRSTRRGTMAGMGRTSGLGIPVPTPGPRF